MSKNAPKSKNANSNSSLAIAESELRVIIDTADKAAWQDGKEKRGVFLSEAIALAKGKLNLGKKEQLPQVVFTQLKQLAKDRSAQAVARVFQNVSQLSITKTKNGRWTKNHMSGQKEMMDEYTARGQEELTRQQQKDRAESTVADARKFIADKNSAFTTAMQDGDLEKAESVALSAKRKVESKQLDEIMKEYDIVPPLALRQDMADHIEAQATARREMFDENGNVKMKSAADRKTAAAIIKSILGK